MTRLGAALAVLAATTALAQPLAPRQLSVVPVYSAPLGVRLTWIERGDADYYDIHRQVNGGPESPLATVTPGVVDQPVSHLDAPLVATSTYTYRVAACNGLGCRSSPTFTTSPRVVWPIAGGREVMHGYNEVSAWNGIGVGLGPTGLAVVGYHMGLDLNKTTPILVPLGDDVVAPRGGMVLPPALGVLDNGSIGVKVDVGGGRFEFDTFNHIATTGADAPPVAAGDIVAPGQRIARIGTLYGGFHGNFAKHVHFMSERSPTPAGQQRIIRHPLSIFTDPADRDPLGNPPVLFDENGDGKVVLFRDHGTGNLITYDLATAPLRGDIDVEPEVVDEQGTFPRQAPIDLGYWIEGPLPDAEQLDDVKSAAHPYRLYDFRVEYFGGIPPAAPTPCDVVSDIADVANSGCRGLMNCSDTPGVACNSVIKEGTTDWAYPVLHHFIVTHASGEIGARADVDRNRFWRTAALDDGTPVIGIDANFHDRQVTTKATEARFPDGDYTIHVVASDLVHSNVDLKLPVTRLENFAPFVKEVLVGIDADGGAGSGQPGLPGCELLVYRFKHTHRQAYPRPQDIVLSKVATTLARSGQKLCVQLRFSEPMTTAAVDLARDRGTGLGIPGATLTGALSKTHQANDTWTGSVVLPSDPSGASDASPVSDEHDVALLILARDRRDAAGAMRLLDTNSSGVPNLGGDLNHVVVRLDLSPPTATLGVIKP